MMRAIVGIVFVVCMPLGLFAQAQDASQLYIKLRNKVDAVKDYVANVDMKIDVAFIRVPKLKGKLYFKAPDKMKLERNGGISILPKNSINMTVNNLLPNAQAAVIDMGTETLGAYTTRVLKVIPDKETDIILSKIWIDETRLLALKTETTTRDNGTIKMELEFGKFEKQSLPDKVTFYLDVKEFKLPKGVTMDYDATAPKTQTPPSTKGNKKGKIQIHYTDYVVNKGIADNVFADKKK